jgi:hypothetical protein
MVVPVPRNSMVIYGGERRAKNKYFSKENVLWIPLRVEVAFFFVFSVVVEENVGSNKSRAEQKSKVNGREHGTS